MEQQLLLDIVPQASPKLSNYVAGANQSALDALRGLAPGQSLYLWGPQGCGRSHLLLAACNIPQAYYVAAKGAAATLEDLATDEARALALVAVDDVEMLGASAQAALFALYNRWRSAAGSARAFALLCAGTQAPAALALREDLRTRLAWGQVCRLQQLSDAERAEALREHARARGMHLPEELLRWMLTHLERDMRRLIALLDALDTFTLARHRSPSLPLLKELLEQKNQLPQ